MSSTSSSARLRATLVAAALSGAALGFSPAAQAQALRPEIGRPLQAAQELIKGGKYREALARVREADAVGPRGEEGTLVERMRLAAASGAGDMEAASKSFDQLASSGKLSGADRARMTESIAVGYYRAGQYAKAQQWGQRYFKEGGTSGAIRTMLIQSQYLSGDFAGASRELTAEIQAAERAGSPPPEDRLKLLLNAATKQNDTNAYVFAMEKLVTYYPKKEYWVDLLARLQRKSTFSDRLVLDTYRLSLATGSMTSPADFMEMTQLALQAELPTESKKVVEQGFSSGVLGKGAEAERHGRLRVLVDKKLAEDKADRAEDERKAAAEKTGDALVSLGMNLAYGSQAAKGVQLIKQGIAKGGLKRPEDAKLHLGIAQVAAGEKANAQATFKSVQGADGTADLARLWSLYTRRSS